MAFHGVHRWWKHLRSIFSISRRDNWCCIGVFMCERVRAYFEMCMGSCVNDSVLCQWLWPTQTHTHTHRKAHIRTTFSAAKPKNTLNKFDRNVRLRTHQLTRFTSQSVCRLQYTILPSLSPFFSVFFFPPFSQYHDYSLYQTQTHMQFAHEQSVFRLWL